MSSNPPSQNTYTSTSTVTQKAFIYTPIQHPWSIQSGHTTHPTAFHYNVAMGSTATSRCWRGRSTSIYANLPLAESSEDIFDFVFGDQEFPSNISSSESMAVSSSLPHAESVASKPDNVLSKPQNDISIFATPLPEFVIEQRQRKLSKESGGSTGSQSAELCKAPTCTIIEEGREWYGYRDEGIRQAAEMFGMIGPCIRPGSGAEDVDDINGTEGEGKGEVKKEKPFWHGNGRKVGVQKQEKWMCVGDDEFGISEELSVVDEGEEGNSEDSGETEGSVDGGDSIQERGEEGGGRKWWSVRWKNVFVMLGCGVLA